jgi:hypothetical protein
MNDEIERALRDPASIAGRALFSQYPSTEAFVDARRRFCLNVMARTKQLDMGFSLHEKVCQVKWPQTMGGGLTYLYLTPSSTFDAIYQGILGELRQRTADAVIRWADGTIINMDALAEGLNDAMRTFGWKGVTIMGFEVTAMTKGNQRVAVGIAGHNDLQHLLEHLAGLVRIEGDGGLAATLQVSVSQPRITTQWTPSLHDKRYLAERWTQDLQMFDEWVRTRVRVGMVRECRLTDHTVEILFTTGRRLQLALAEYDTFDQVIRAIDRAAVSPRD